MLRELYVMFDCGGISTGKDKIYHITEVNGGKFS
jgi:hypothetical protein